MDFADREIKRDRLQKARTLLQLLGWEVAVDSYDRLVLKSAMPPATLKVEPSEHDPLELIITEADPPTQFGPIRLSELVRRTLRLRKRDLPVLQPHFPDSRRSLNELHAGVIDGKRLSRQELVDAVLNGAGFERMIIIGRPRDFKSTLLRTLHDALAEHYGKEPDRPLPLFLDGVRLDWKKTLLGALASSEVGDRLVRFGPEQMRLLLEGGDVHVIIDDLDRSLVHLSDSTATARVFGLLQGIQACRGFTLGVHRDLIFAENPSSESNLEFTSLGESLRKMPDTVLVELLEEHSDPSKPSFTSRFVDWCERYAGEGMMSRESRITVLRQFAVVMWSSQRSLLDRDQVDQIVSANLPPLQRVLAVIRRLREQFTDGEILRVHPDGLVSFRSADDQIHCLTDALAVRLKHATTVGHGEKLESLEDALRLPRLTPTQARRIVQASDLRELLACQALLRSRYSVDASENALLIVHAAVSDGLLPAPDLNDEAYRLEGARLIDARLAGAKLAGAKLSRCLLLGASLREADLQRAELDQCVAINASFEEAEMSGAHLEKSDLTAGSARNADLRGADLSDCSLFLASLDGADLRHGARLDRADISATTTSGIEMDGASTIDTNVFRVDGLRSAAKKADTATWRRQPNQLYVELITSFEGRARQNVLGFCVESGRICEVDTNNCLVVKNHSSSPATSTQLRRAKGDDRVEEVAFERGGDSPRVLYARLRDRGLEVWNLDTCGRTFHLGDVKLEVITSRRMGGIWAGDNRGMLYRLRVGPSLREELRFVWPPKSPITFIHEVSVDNIVIGSADGAIALATAGRQMKIASEVVTRMSTTQDGNPATAAVMWDHGRRLAVGTDGGGVEIFEIRNDLAHIITLRTTEERHAIDALQIGGAEERCLFAGYRIGSPTQYRVVIWDAQTGGYYHDFRIQTTSLYQLLAECVSSSGDVDSDTPLSPEEVRDGVLERFALPIWAPRIIGEVEMEVSPQNVVAKDQNTLRLTFSNRNGLLRQSYRARSGYKPITLGADISYSFFGQKVSRRTYRDTEIQMHEQEPGIVVAEVVAQPREDGELVVRARLRLDGVREPGNECERHVAVRYRNPFAGGGQPITKPSAFFGRDAVMRKLISVLDQSSVLLLGQRRIGKTSLLLAVQRQLRATDVVIFLNLQRLTEYNISNLARHLCAAFEELGLHAVTPRPKPSADTDASLELKSILKWMRENAIAHFGDTARVVLLLDEVKIVSNLTDEEQGVLRSYVNGFSEWLRIVLAGPRGDIKREVAHHGSPWYNTWKTIRLDAMTDVEITQLVRESSAGLYEFSDEAIRALLLRASGRPYYAQVMCGEAARIASERKPDAQIIEVEERDIELGFHHLMDSQGLMNNYETCLAELPEAVRQRLGEVIREDRAVTLSETTGILQPVYEHGYIGGNDLQVEYPLRFFLKGAMHESIPVPRGNRE